MREQELKTELRRIGARDVQVAALSADPERAFAALDTARDKGAEHVVGYALSLYDDPEWRPNGARARRVTNASVTVKCDTCDGDRFIVVQTRVDTYAGKSASVDEYAPCPACNATSDLSYWRSDGTRFVPPDPARVRELMKR